MPNNAALSVRNLTMDFGGLRAVGDVSFNVERGEILALIGPNGAGKTTLFNCVTGIYRPTSGKIFAAPTDESPRRIDGQKPNRISQFGLARTFQNIHLFGNMSALENVMVGRHPRTHAGILGAVLRDAKTQKEERAIAADSYRLLVRFGLAKFAHAEAKSLPYAFRRRLEMARALASEPFLLLLDEPAAGMNPRETLELDSLIRRLRDEFRLSVLLIEHDMRLVMRLAERIVVVDHGVKLAEGKPNEIRNDPEVIRAYLGEAPAL